MQYFIKQKYLKLTQEKSLMSCGLFILNLFIYLFIILFIYNCIYLFIYYYDTSDICTL